MEGIPDHLKLPTWARHRTWLLQDAILKGHLSTQCIVYRYSPVRHWTTVDHTGEAAGLDSFPTVSTLSEERMLSALPKSWSSQSLGSCHLLLKKTLVAYSGSFLLLRVIFQLLTIRHPWAILLELIEQLKVQMKIYAVEFMHSEYDDSFWNSARIDWKRKTIPDLSRCMW